MIVNFTDKTRRYVPREIGLKLQAALVQGTEFVKLGGDLYKAATIASVLDDQPQDLRTPLLASSTLELTQEQRQANIERIRKMKRDFMGARSGS